MRPAGGRERYAGPVDHPRLFVAVPLVGEVCDRVASVVEAVRAQPLPPGMHDVRWVRLDGLHLTLTFIGPVAPELVPAIADEVASVASAGEAGMGVLAGTGTFPPHGRPRTIWIGVAEGGPTLAALVRAQAGVLAAAGRAPDDRPYHAHLTVARSDGLVAGPLVAQRLAAAMGEARIPFAIDRLTLFESRTGGGPARYVPVAEAVLGGSR